MPKDVDVLVVGGGIVGLAVARELRIRWPNRSVCVLEKEAEIGRHQTGHNSGVVHSGLYYRPGSAKAEHCVRGGRLLEEFCERHGVSYRRCGKLVVASGESECQRLGELERRGVANGVGGIEQLGRQAMREIEPHVAGDRALWVPSTGVVDFGAVAKALEGSVRGLGGEVLCGVAFRGAAHDGARVRVSTSRGSIRAGALVTCAGLHADRVAKLSGAEPGLRIVPFRGEYYELRESARHLVRGLIYPTPDPSLPFLGVHFTVRVDGAVDAGPNAVLTWRREGYRKGAFRPADFASTVSFAGFWRLAVRHWRAGAAELRRSYSKRVFVAALRRLVPEISADDLCPSTAGVRAQAVDPQGELLDDFALVEGPRALHICNAPSPAATASLSIAQAVADRVGSLGLVADQPQ